jgi:hypothetical protein
LSTTGEIKEVEMNDVVWVDPRRVAAVVYDVGVAVDQRGSTSSSRLSFEATVRF